MSVYSNNLNSVYSSVYRGLYGGANPLVFHALTHAGASGGVDAAGNTLLPYEGTDTLVATVAGMTEGRTTTNLAPDHEGVWRSWGSGEAVREGFRQVENLCPYSEDLSQWSQIGCTVSGNVVSYTSVNYPSIVIDCGSPAIGTRWIVSFKARLVSGSAPATRTRISTGFGNSLISLTSTMQRYSVWADADDTSGNVSIYISWSGIPQTGSVEITEIQVEDATGRTDQTTPSEYVYTNGAAAKKYFASTNPWTVDGSNVATATATVTPLTDVWTKGEPAHTNSLPYSLPSVDQWSLTEGTAGDLVTNGDFETGDFTGWIAPANFTVVDDGSTTNYVARCDGLQGAAVLLYQFIGVTTGNIYKVTYTVSNISAGQVRLKIGSNGAYTAWRATNNTYTDYLEAADNGILFIQADSSFAGDVDDIIVQPAVIESYTTGLTGAADTAVILTDDDGSAAEYIRETVSITSSTDTHVVRYFIKKDTNETRFPAFDFYITTGGTFQRLFVSLNTKTGAAYQRASTGTTDYEVRDTGHGWFELLLSVTDNDTGNTAIIIDAYPAYSTTLSGSAAVAATGSVTISDPVELHLNTSIAAVRGSSPIFTNGSAASTVASAISSNVSNWGDSHALYAEFMSFADNDGLSHDQQIVGNTTFYIGTGLSVINGSAPWSYYNAGTNASNAQSLVADVEYKYAIAKDISAGKLNLNRDGTWGTEVSDFTSVRGTTTGINIGRGAYASVLIRNVRAYQAPYATQQTIIDGLMS